MSKLPINIKLIFTLIIAFGISSCVNSDKSEEYDNDLVVKTYQLSEGKPLSNDYIIKAKNICDYWYNNFLKNTRFNGAVLVAKNGSIIYEKYRGTAHLGYPDSVNANTPFHIASVSKTFTAMATLKLWEQKKINIDDEYSIYFPDFNYPGVTIRTLLNHRSGLPNYVYFMDELGWDRKKFATNQDVYDYLVNKKSALKNIGSPNRGFSYCNTNYALLALLIEKISGMSYAEYLKKTIFDPMQMKNSFVFTNADSSKTTPSYDWRGYQAVFIDVDKIVGDKNIFSTPRDLLKWDRLLSSGLYLSQKTLDEAYKPYSNERAGIRNYGLGWRMYAFPDGKKIIYHNGWWHGNNAVFIRLLKEDATIIVLGNQYNNAIYKARYLVGLFNPKYGSSDDDESDNNGSK